MSFDFVSLTVSLASHWKRSFLQAQLTCAHSRQRNNISSDSNTTDFNGSLNQFRDSQCCLHLSQIFLDHFKIFSLRVLYIQGSMDLDNGKYKLFCSQIASNTIYLLLVTLQNADIQYCFKQCFVYCNHLIK